MATLVLAAVGQAIAGPVGSLVGAVAGSFIDRQIFRPGGGLREGPRLKDLSVQGASYGAPIPLIYGRARVAGNVIWSSGLVESRSEERSGGKGGGGGTTTVRFNYSASLAVALSGRPIARVERIWADGKLIRAASGPLSVGGTLRVYAGEEGQQPDPVIEAAQGVGQVPAHRGLAYAVLEDLPLAEFANRVPNLNFEVVADEPNAGLAAVALDIAGRVGLAPVDGGGLTGSVAGFVTDGGTGFRDALENLSLARDFSAVESQGVLYLRDMPQGAIDFDAARLGAGEEGAPRPRIERMQAEASELPRETRVYFWDTDRDYQPNVQRARRRTAASEGASAFSAPVALDAATAKAAAERRLEKAWSGRARYSLSLPPTDLAIEPGDVIRLPATPGGAPLMLVEDKRYDGVSVRLAGRVVDLEAVTGAGLADGGSPIGQTLRLQGPTFFTLFDLPALTPEQLSMPRFYFAATGDDDAWRSASLFESGDGGLSYQPVARSALPAIMGAALDALPPASPHVWDLQNTVRVGLDNPQATLESRSQIAVLGGANAALLGDEVIQFRNAALQADGSYILSQLLRGRGGSEAAIAGHLAGERFVLLDRTSIVAINATLAQVGETRRYKAVGPNEALINAGETPFTFTAANLRPLAPVHVRGRRQADGAISISWIRRSRAGAAWIDGADAPLAEESEAYDLEILNGATVARSYATTTPQALYSAADQLSDFGGLPATLSLRLYQRSAQVGRGLPAQVTIAL
ncbi:MAG: phage tail protein [Pseudomonadota bacterium]